jgi:hypothetical protein
VAGPPQATLNVMFPLWAAALLMASLPAYRLWRDHRSHRARRRESEGRCLNCGYDLRATPGRCPECGAVPAAVEQAAVQSLAGTRR